MIRDYIRVSTEEQEDSGLGIEAQRTALGSGPDEKVYVEIASAKDFEDSPRPILEGLLDEMEAGDMLRVAKLDRLSRSVMDFGVILKRARKGGWHVVAIDLGVDTSTPTGELLANIIMAVAQWERRMIGQRTREALAVKQQNGQRLGRPAECHPELEAQILELSKRMGPTMIARRLTEMNVPTPRGGTAWYPTTVSRILERLEESK
jgi:DNA invertase Pin-like site-specific DNA recombinase